MHEHSSNFGGICGGIEEGRVITRGELVATVEGVAVGPWRSWS